MFVAFALALAVASPAQAVRPEVGPVFALDAVDADGDGDVIDAVKRKSVKKRKPVRRTPAPAPAPRPESTPVNVGLGGAAGAAIGGAVGLTGVVTSALVATGVFGEQPPEVVFATSAIGLTIAAATPIMAGLGGGIGVLLADKRAQPKEWSGLLQCATSGCCAGLAAVGGGLLGGGFGVPGAACVQVPGPDRPAEWTAFGAVGGLLGGAAAGAVAGYLVAPDKTDPLAAVTIGGVGGALLGTATVAGFAGGIAAALRP